MAHLCARHVQRCYSMQNKSWIVARTDNRNRHAINVRFTVINLSRKRKSGSLCAIQARGCCFIIRFWQYGTCTMKSRLAPTSRKSTPPIAINGNRMRMSRTPQPYGIYGIHDSHQRRSCSLGEQVKPIDKRYTGLNEDLCDIRRYL